MFLTGRAALGFVTAAAVALVVPGNPWVAIMASNAVLLLAVTADVVLSPSPRRIVTGRRHPPVVTMGGEVEVALAVRNPGPRAIRIALRDRAVPSLGAEPRRLDARLKAGIEGVTYRLRPLRRGRFELGPVTVRVFGPLGLAGRQRTVPPVTPIKVYPQLEGRRQVEGRLRRERLLEAGTKSARFRGGGLEFDSLREYHPDDEFRRINWAATVRAGKPISNVYREERNQQLLLLLDAGRTMAATVAGAPRFEHALDAAVALATLAAQVGDRVGAFAFSDRVRATVPPRSDAGQVGRIVDSMFDVEPSVVASDYHGAIGAVLTRFRRRALLALFTDLADEAALDSLLTTIGVLSRRHLVVVVEVADPEVDRIAGAVPRSAPEAFAKAAAASAQERRRRAGARLRRLGASVVDRTPQGLAGAVADEYLRAKAAGKL